MRSFLRNGGNVRLRSAVAFLVLAAAVALAQSSGEQTAATQKGFVGSISFEGSADNSGHMLDLGTFAGYRFNRHFQMDVGVPYYFLSSPASGSATGIGNTALAMRLLFPNDTLNYATSLTTFIPTGNESLGLSTGRVTFDWNNHIDRGFGRVTPRLDAGLANTVVDSRYFVRQFTTLGANAHAEAGASFDLFKHVSLEASAYDILPWGTQKMYSRAVRAGMAGNPNPQHGRAFEGSHFTQGGPSLTSDNGLSAGLDVTPAPCMDLYGGFTRSMKFAQDEVSFGIGLNVGQLMRQNGCKKK